MTLANFNSNFNWQLRMLKEAAECCGIIPDNPPPLPPVDCYWFGKIHDPNCFSFNPIGTDWLLNGIQPFAWNGLMQNTPYGTVGNAMQYTDPFSGCSSFAYSDYYFWTMVPSSVLTLPDLTGNDSNGNPALVTMFQGACATKCYEGTLTSLFGSTIIYRIETVEFNAGEYSFIVDLADPAVNTNFTLSLGAYYPPTLNVTVTVVAPNQYTIRIDGLYSAGSQVNVYLDDGSSSTTLGEVPC